MCLESSSSSTTTTQRPLITSIEIHPGDDETTLAMDKALPNGIHSSMKSKDWNVFCHHVDQCMMPFGKWEETIACINMVTFYYGIVGSMVGFLLIGVYAGIRKLLISTTDITIDVLLATDLLEFFPWMVGLVLIMGMTSWCVILPLFRSMLRIQLSRHCKDLSSKYASHGLLFQYRKKTESFDTADLDEEGRELETTTYDHSYYIDIFQIPQSSKPQTIQESPSSSMGDIEEDILQS